MTAFTKDEKRALVSAILEEVPKINYEAKVEARARELAVEGLPQLAKALWKDSSTRGLLATHNVSFWEDAAVSYSYKTRVANVSLPGFEDTVEALRTDEEVVSLCTASAGQRALLEKLRWDLEARLESIRTVKQLGEQFPDFVRFLPSKQQSVANLPATTALMDGLRAAGWPKNQEAAA